MSKTYSVKYLGISNGQVGILSKRLPIPRLSRLDSCKNKPLSVIYAAAFRLPNPPKRRIKSLLSKIELLEDSFKDTSIAEVFSPRKHSETEKLPTAGSKCQTDETGSIADLQPCNEYLVNKYSRPRGLKSARKTRAFRFNVNDEWLEDRFVAYNRRSIMTPMPRSGMVGWKISRPRTPTTRASSQAGIRRTPLCGDFEAQGMESIFGEKRSQFKDRSF